mgnify:CR=1 FL=1
MFNKESGLVKTWVTLIKNKQYTATLEDTVFENGCRDKVVPVQFEVAQGVAVCQFDRVHLLVPPLVS